MAKQVPWNEIIYMTFSDLAMLSITEREVLRMRIMGYSVVQTAMELNVSESTVHRMIKELKWKYDQVQPHSDKLPPRKPSKKELWMDKH